MNRNIIILGLLSSVSAWCLGVSAVCAQTPDMKGKDKTGFQSEIVAPEQVDLSKRIEFVADMITYDSRNNVVIAAGNVQLTQQKNSIYADTITFKQADDNQSDGQVIASGNIRFTDGNGNIIFADKLDLTDDLKDGFIANIKALLSDNSRIAANSGERKDGKITIFRHAVYSPCNVCAGKPEKPPLWQIKAARVIHDTNKNRIAYHDAYLEFWGVPVAYTPYLSQPDHSVHAGSGFLAPSIGRTSELGMIFRAPYYFSLARDKDLTLTPVMTTREGPVLFAEYRQNVGFGKFDATGSGTYVDQRDNLGLKTGDKEFRGHFFSKGKFHLNDFAGLGGDWQWRYDAQLVSDDTYLRRYDVSKTDTLTSDLILEQFKGRSYGALSAYHFRGLRIEDRAGRTPIVLPMLEYHYISDPGFMGAKVKLDANAMAITRTDGMDTRRISLAGSWQVPLITAAGDLLTMTASLRGDAYQVADSNHPDNIANAGKDGFTSRVLPRLTLNWRRPLVKYGKTTQQVIEPIIMMVAAPNGGNSDSIPNEDSRSFELDDLNLFTADRFTGLDLWEGGSRVAYGMRYGLYGARTQARFTVGQSYQFDKNDIFSEASGLSGHWSDYILALNVSFSPYLDYIHKIRLDKKSFLLRRNEARIIAGPKSFKVTVGYLDINRDLSDFGDNTNDLEDRREIRTAVKYHINDNWSTYGSYIRNLKNGGKSIYSDAGILYQNECIQLEFSIRKRFTRDRDIEPSTSYNFRIVLKHLG